MTKDKFSFGSNPSMREVPLGATAEFTFTGKPKIIDTEWGEKYSFPISLSFHPSYDTLPPTGNKDADKELEGQTVSCEWQSKSQVAKEVYKAHEGNVGGNFIFAYQKSKWKLTRFDNGSYWKRQRTLLLLSHAVVC
jgi:hypothetical protein